MANILVKKKSPKSIPIFLVATNTFNDWLPSLTPLSQSWVEMEGFSAVAGEICWLPDREGKPDRVAIGWDGQSSLETIGALPYKLPEGVYRFTTPLTEIQVLGWMMGTYRFNHYKTPQRAPAKLVAPENLDLNLLEHIASSVHLARDLINMPANDMGPSQLTNEATKLAQKNKASIRVIQGDELLNKKLFAIHAVGRAAADEPRLIDMSWGNPSNPKITIVGKGVCFDSGGLNIKPGSAIRHMKKDMGGAAISLGLANLIMKQNLPVHLRILIGAVENAISDNAYRPGDVIKTYKGLTVEIDNTDAEGRLIMCDCLALASEEDPSLIIDFSTLTGSARSAVGAEISAMFCNDDNVAEGIYDAGCRTQDPVWRMPLHHSYKHMLKSNVADTLNSSPSPYAGAITAALFLEQFVGEKTWVHFDINAFNIRDRAARPEGGEAMAMRAIFDYLSEQFGD